jgi:uncharacterized LabA/DUF88 family protein
MRVAIYIDGFNLYYRALRGTPYRWLDLRALSEGFLDPGYDISLMRYFTAPVSGKLDPSQPIRQQTYLRALQTLPDLTIHLGSFLSKVNVRPLLHPLADGTTHVQVVNSEEKGSDVNLASYLIHDAWCNRYDLALILSQDTDLLEPVRLVREEIGKQVGVIQLDGKQPGKLAKSANFVRHVTPARLAAAQFQPTLQLNHGKTLRCPTSWQ